MYRPILALGLTPALQRTLRFTEFKPGDVNRAREVTITAAGKCVNVGLALAILGDQAYVTGFNGGSTGRMLIEDVLHRGGLPAFTPIQGETRICDTIIDDATGTVTELVQEAPPVTEADLARLTRRLLRLLPSSSGLSISGTLPKGFPPDAYIPFGRKATELGIPWIVDSQKEALLATLPERPTLAKLNRFELGQTTGSPCKTEKECVAALRDLVRRGAKWMLMTDGPHHALLVSEMDVLRVKPPHLRKVCSPIGSGDCASAGIIHSLVHGLPVPDAVAYGLACGTANARTYIPAVFTKPEE